jgi:hypothetical protein
LFVSQPHDPCGNVDRSSSNVVIFINILKHNNLSVRDAYSDVEKIMTIAPPLFGEYITMNITPAR